MSFKDRRGTTTRFDLAGSHALDVFPMGGILNASAALNPGVNVILLTAPPAGYVWALHTATSDDTFPFYVVNNGVTVLANVAAGTSFAMNGQICTGSVGVKGISGAAGGTGYLTYDLVVAPNFA